MQSPRKAAPNAGLASSIHVFEVHPEFTVAAIEDVLVQLWNGKPTIETLDRLDGYYGGLLKRHARISIIAVINADVSALPGAAERERSAALINKYERQLDALCYVIEGKKIKHTVVRFAAATVELLSGSRVPQPVFESVEKACRWLEDTLQHAPLSNLVRDVAQLRALRP